MSRTSNSVVGAGLVVGAAVCANLSAADLQVGDVPRLDYAEALTITAQTEAIGTDLPDGVPSPVFWLDAMDSDQWTVNKDSEVSFIPSKEGSRKLTSSLADGHFKGWPANDSPGASMVTPYSPVLVSDEQDLVGGKALDFKERGKRRALVFDAVSVPDGSASASNILTQIGTVIAVIKPQENSYFPLSGGFGNPKRTGDNWLRGSDECTQASATDQLWTAPLLRYSSSGAYAPESAAYAVVRHNGQPTAANTTGWPGGWEVMSFTPKAADLVATGVGVGRECGYGYSYSGGFKLAEMLVFGVILSLEDTKRIEAYLNRKWFGKSVAGYGGNANVGWLHTGAIENKTSSTTVVVPEGETMTVERLQGGRYGSDVIKQGAGELALEDVSGFGGDLALDGGTVSFPARAMPTVAEVSEKAYAHFDASQVDSFQIETDDVGRERVSVWSNLCETTLYGNSFGLRANSNVRRPTLRRNVLGDGLHVLDFNAFQSSDAASLVFSRMPPESVLARVVPCVTTVIGVFGAQDNGGGHLFSSAAVDDNIGAWSRPSGWPAFGSSLVGTKAAIRTNTSSPLYPTNSLILLEGVKGEVGTGYRHAGYQTVAIRMPGASVRELARSEAGHLGGLRVCELFVFRRVLSEVELRDVSAYLENKWFGKIAPGYRRATGDMQYLGKIKVESGSVVSVPANATIRAGALVGSANLTKEGEGTLAVERLDSDGEIIVKAGAMKVVDATDPGEDSCKVAYGASLHLDACDVDRMDLGESGDNTTVSHWLSKTGKGSVGNSGRPPYLRRNQPREGLNIVDFSTYGVAGRYLNFDTSRDSVRSVFAIWRSTGKQSPLLGSSTAVPEAVAKVQPYDFVRNATSGALLSGFTYQYTNVDSVYTNGAASTYGYIVQNMGLHLVELNLKKGFHASALAVERNTANAGGQELGEIIVYERELSEREKQSTRNYLMKKWFGVEPKPLTPKAPVNHHVAKVSVCAGAAAMFGGVMTVDAFDVSALSECPVFSVDGTFAIPAGMTVNISDAEKLPSQGDVRIPIVTATDFTGTDKQNLRSVVFTGYPVGRSKPRLVVLDTTLYVQIPEKRGLVLFVR